MMVPYPADPLLYLGNGFMLTSHLPLAVTAADRLASDSNSKSLSRKPGPYYILSSTTEPVTIDEDDMPNTLSLDQALLAVQSEIHASATGASASHYSEYPEGLLGEYSAADWPISPIDAQQLTTKGISRATSEVYHDTICENGKCSKGNMNDNRKYTVDQIVLHVDKGAYTQSVRRWYGNTATYDTIEPSENIPTHFINLYWKKVN